MSQAEQEIRAVIERRIAALRAKDAPAAVACVADDRRKVRMFAVAARFQAATSVKSSSSPEKAATASA
jgi:hypothetical protein